MPHANGILKVPLDKYEIKNNDASFDCSKKKSVIKNDNELAAAKIKRMSYLGSKSRRWSAGGEG